MILSPLNPLHKERGSLDLQAYRPTGCLHPCTGYLLVCKTQCTSNHLPAEFWSDKIPFFFSLAIRWFGILKKCPPLRWIIVKYLLLVGILCMVFVGRPAGFDQFECSWVKIKHNSQTTLHSGHYNTVIQCRYIPELIVDSLISFCSSFISESASYCQQNKNE